MNRLILLLLVLSALLVNGASIPKKTNSSEPADSERKREGRTLGLLSTATGVLQSGIGTASKVLLGLTAAKPIILTGLAAKYIYDKVQDGRSEVPTNLGATSTGFPAATFSKPTYVDTTATRFDLLQPGVTWIEDIPGASDDSITTTYYGNSGFVEAQPVKRIYHHTRHNVIVPY